MAKPGQRSDRSTARIRRDSGKAVGSILLMINLEGEHCTQNGVCQMIIAGVAGEIGVKMLDSLELLQPVPAVIKPVQIGTAAGH